MKLAPWYLRKIRQDQTSGEERHREPWVEQAQRRLAVTRAERQIDGWLMEDSFLLKRSFQKQDPTPTHAKKKIKIWYSTRLLIFDFSGRWNARGNGLPSSHGKWTTNKQSIANSSEIREIGSVWTSAGRLHRKKRTPGEWYVCSWIPASWCPPNAMFVGL